MQKWNVRKLILMYTLILAACIPTAQADGKLPKAAIPTNTETPVPVLGTPTSIPLAEIDLRTQILVPSSEMPAGYRATNTKDSPPDQMVPEPLKMIWQKFETGDAVAGGVRVYLYASVQDVENAYSNELEYLSSSSTTITETTEVGDQATIMSSEDYATDLVFTRCDAVVSIRMVDIPSWSVLIDYAQKLDENIIQFICRDEQAE